MLGSGVNGDSRGWSDMDLVATDTINVRQKNRICGKCDTTLGELNHRIGNDWGIGETL